MSREIKFDYLVKRHNGFVFHRVFELHEIEIGGVAVWMNANCVNGSDLFRRQFTGLHDRLGREIYEGDILRTESEKVYLLSGMPSGKTSISLSVVIWKDDGWGYRFAKNIQNADYTNNFETKGLTVKAQYSDVVGNIYEHPHLISELPGR